MTGKHKYLMAADPIPINEENKCEVLIIKITKNGIEILNNKTSWQKQKEAIDNFKNIYYYYYYEKV
jgi:hypothetical protein